MLTQERIDKFYRDVEALGLKYPVAEIHKKTGVSKGQVSQVLNKKLAPSEQLINKFNESFNIVQQNSVEPAKIYLDSSAVKVTLQDYINKIEQHNAFLQRMIESGLVEIKVSLNDARADLEWLEKWQWAEHKVQMQALDKLTKKDPGTLAAEAGTLLSGDQLATELAGRKTNGNK